MKTSISIVYRICRWVLGAATGLYFSRIERFRGKRVMVANHANSLTRCWSWPTAPKGEPRGTPQKFCRTRKAANEAITSGLMKIDCSPLLKIKRLANMLLSKGCLNFEITNRCQLRCAHCYFFRNNTKQKELTLGQIIAIAQEFRNNGGKHAWITGGEPSVRMDAVEKVLEIVANVKIVTNGYIPIPSKYQPLIFFSVDGGREDNLKVRGNDTWQNLFNNYRNDKRVVSVMTVNSQNRQSMEEFVSLSREANIRGAVFSIYTPSLLNEQDRLVLSAEQKREVFHQFTRLKKEYGLFLKMGKNLMRSILEGVRFQRCVWRNSKVLRFDGSYKFCPMFEKEAEADCRNCGCVSAAILIRPYLNLRYCLDLV